MDDDFLTTINQYLNHEIALHPIPTTACSASINLEKIASSDNLNATVLDLTTWAESSDRLPELLDGTCQQNSDNRALQKVAAEIRQALAEEDKMETELDSLHQAPGSGEEMTPLNPIIHDPTLASPPLASRGKSNSRGTRREIFTYDVFLSHSSADKPIVRALAERLRADGLRVWFDERIIQPWGG